MKPEVIHLRHPQESVGVRHRRGIKDVRVELLVQYQTDHIVKHRRLFEGGVRRRDLDEGLDVDRNVGELQELNQPLPYLRLVPIDGRRYVDLCRVEVPGPLDLLDSLLPEVLPEETRKAVDGICRGDENLLPHLLRQVVGGGPSDGRLANPSLPAAEDAFEAAPYRHERSEACSGLTRLQPV